MSAALKKEQDDKEALMKKCQELEMLLGAQKVQHDNNSSVNAADSSSHSVSSLHKGLEDMNMNGLSQTNNNHTINDGDTDTSTHAEQYINLTENGNHDALGGKNVVDVDKSFNEGESEISIGIDQV